jgi:hypothetical protein
VTGFFLFSTSLPLLRVLHPKEIFVFYNIFPNTANIPFYFTAKIPGKPKIEIPNVVTYAIDAFDYRRILRRNNETGYLPEQQKSAGWKQWGIKFINTFPVNILLGEGGLFYVNSILKKANTLIRQEKITHIYSSFRPFADHYIAYRLKKKNPSLTWIADFRDLIIDPHYVHHLFAKKQEQYYKKIFKLG